MRYKLYAAFLVVIVLTIIIGLISLFKPKTENVNEYSPTQVSKENNSYDGKGSVTNNTKNYKTSSGYSSDKNYKPTVDNKGSYTTIDGKRKQIQYQGSKEQKEHLDEMKKRGW